MSDGRLLLSVATRFIPDYSERFEWGDIWRRPLISGTAFEWTTLAAFAAVTQRRGWQYSFPMLGLESGRSLFPLRNELPRQHGAQAGHGAVEQHSQPLARRFLQAFTPKVVFEKGDEYYSVFREGCAYHEVMSRGVYDERPDILVLPGRPVPGFPRLIQGDTYVEFAFDLTDGPTISGQLRVIDATKPYIRRCEPEAGMTLPITGIVECSVNKTAVVAENQLQTYARLFSYPTVPPMVLVTGNDLSSLQRPGVVVDLASNDVDIIERNFCDAASLILDHFSIA